MSAPKCKKADCTLASTGECLLRQEPSDCEHYVASTTVPEQLADAPETDLAEPQQDLFHLGLELGARDAAELMRARYAHLIAVAGFWNAGKTSLLTSLYLMASCRDLAPSYTFSGCYSFRAFEERARGLRRWKKRELPAKLMEHTTTSSPRNPALLHLALSTDSRRFDTLWTDLPGEWFDDLVKHSSAADRFAFLQRADGIVYVVDGERLAAPETRHVDVNRHRLLLRRFRDSVGVDVSRPFVLLVSKVDKLADIPTEDIDALAQYAGELGFAPHTVLSAAFSVDPTKMPNGMGVIGTLDHLLRDRPTESRAPVASRRSKSTRIFQRFRE